jgi:putative hydrolase of the HAD superfamily
MSSSGPGRGRPAVFLDIGGVLMPEYLPAAVDEWSARLGISGESLVAAVFRGNDDQVLIGRVSEPAWWRVVGDRLGVGPDLAAELRRDLVSREAWDGAMLALLRELRGRASIAVISNAWPHMRASLERAGLVGTLDAVVLSCEVGWAKPDARIYTAALQRVAADPGDVLFIDDTRGHVAAAESLGMTGHVHVGTASTIARIEDFLRHWA